MLCKRCNKKGEFYAGRVVCKECVKADVRANYCKRHEQYRLFERERNRQPSRRRSKSEAGKRHYLRYPERAKARYATSNAIRDGRLERRPCENCGSMFSEAHHEDYSQQLDVVWLCRRCHRAREGRLVV